MWLNDLFWGIRAHFWGEIITFWWWMITLEGPQCFVDKSSKKILARGRAPPLLTFPALWEHLVLQPLPYKHWHTRIFTKYNIMLIKMIHPFFWRSTTFRFIFPAWSIKSVAGCVQYIHNKRFKKCSVLLDTLCLAFVAHHVHLSAQLGRCVRVHRHVLGVCTFERKQLRSAAAAGTGSSGLSKVAGRTHQGPMVSEEAWILFEGGADTA